jgi:hypothetical protein
MQIRALEERRALETQLSKLQAASEAAAAQHEKQLAEAAALRERELCAVEERVRQLSDKKDATIHTLHERLAALQAELHDTREQLHTTQQEILSFA